MTAAIAGEQQDLRESASSHGRTFLFADCPVSAERAVAVRASRRRRRAPCPWSRLPAGSPGRRSPRRPRRRVTSRPVGWRASRAARSAAGSSAASSRRCTHGVSAVPGLTQLTRMPSRTWSAAIARVSDSTAPLVAVERPLGQAGGGGDGAGVDDRGVTPTPAAMRQGGRATRTMPRTLMSKHRCHSSSALSSTVPAAPMPALLTTMSSPPSGAAAAGTASRTCASSLTSAAHPHRPGGSRSSRRRPRHARRSRAVVAARPMPDAPPVTTARRPLELQGRHDACSVQAVPSGNSEVARSSRRASRRREPGSHRRGVRARHDQRGVGEVLVQVVDVLDDAVLRGPQTAT